MNKILKVVCIFLTMNLHAQESRGLYTQLIGNWEVTSTQIEKEAATFTSDEKKTWLEIKKRSSYLNELIKERKQRMVIEFDVNGTYKFVIFENGQANYEETGSFFLSGTEIKCQNNQAGKSSYDNHLIISITENSFTVKHYLSVLNNKAFETFTHTRLNY